MKRKISSMILLLLLVFPLFSDPLPDLVLTIEDYMYGSDPGGEFKPQTFTGGVHVLNINNARSYTVIYKNSNIPAMKYLRQIDEHGNNIDLDLSTYPGYYMNSSTIPGDNSQLLEIVKFMALDAQKKPAGKPLYVLFRNMKKMNSFFAYSLPKMDTAYIGSAIGGNWPKSTSPGCINHFLYEKFILNNTNILKALDYHNWTTAEKQTFYNFLRKLEAAGSLDFDNDDKNYKTDMNFQEVIFSEKKARQISLLYAAHFLFVEVNGKVKWSISGLSPEIIQTLFHPRYLFRIEVTPNKLTTYAAKNFIATHPNNIKDFAVKNFLKATQEETIYSFVKWVGKNFKHDSPYYIGKKFQTFTTFNKTAPPKITMGCGASSEYMAATARSLNIPALVYSNGHSAIHFPSIDKGMAHSDDPYTFFFYDIPFLVLDNPFTRNVAGTYNALGYYRSEYELKGLTSSQEWTDTFKKRIMTAETYDRKLMYLHTHSESEYLMDICSGYSDFKRDWDRGGFYSNYFGKERVDCIYCCARQYVPRHKKYKAGTCSAATANIECEKLITKPDACFGVRFITTLKPQLFAPGTADYKKFMAGSEIPKDYLNKIKNVPNYIPVWNPGGKLTPLDPPYMQDNFKHINYFLLGSSQTAVLKKWR